MPIVSSVISDDAAQRDGRRWITELHTDHLGEQYRFAYLGPAGVDANAILSARVSGIAQALIDREVGRNVEEIMRLGSEATPTLRHSTVAENVLALRQAYASAARLEAIMAGDYLSARTDAQLRTAFSMTAAQVTTLRTNKLTPAANAAATIRAASGG